MQAATTLLSHLSLYDLVLIALSVSSFPQALMGRLYLFKLSSKYVT